MTVALTGDAEPRGDYFGEIRKSDQIGRKLTSPRKMIWLKCPHCGEGKWSHLEVPGGAAEADGITSKTRCSLCATSFNRVRAATLRLTEQPARFFRFCPICELHRRLDEFYIKRGKNYPQGYCIPCTKQKRKEDYVENREQIREREKLSRQRERLAMIEAYGGKCECCGESHHEFLTLDHIGGGGNEHRRQLGGTSGVLREIASQGYPRDKYRLLCYNCNCSIGARGYCPHSRLNSTSNENKS